MASMPPFHVLRKRGHENRTVKCLLEEVPAMRTIVAILIVLGAGLFIGSRFEGARTAHHLFTSYRVRAVNGLSGWFTKAFAAGLGIAGLVFALYLLYR